MGIEWVKGKGFDDENKVVQKRVFPAERRRRRAQELLAGVVSGGTGKAAQIGEFAAGKTGTTENYGDAWFVGFNKELTVAVWVGYPDKLVADADRVPRRAGGRRHVPGRDLARLHARLRSGIRDQRADRPGQGPERGRRDDHDPGRARSHVDRPEHHAGGGRARRRRAAGRAAAGARGGAALRRRRLRRTARRRPRLRLPPRRRPRPRPTRAAVAATAAPWRRARPPGGRASPAASGRDTWRLSASQKRQGSSTAFVMPIRSPVTTRGSRAGRRGRGSRPGRRAARSRSGRGRSPSAWVSLPGPEQSASGALEPAARAHQVDALQRLERADQHGGAHALGLGHGVQQRVHAVREVDVGVPGRAEERAACGA